MAIRDQESSRWVMGEKSSKITACTMAASMLLSGLATVRGAEAQSLPSPDAQADTVDLSTYFPNFKQVDQGQYLEGYNVLLKGFDAKNPLATGRTVLVFRRTSGDDFQMTTTAPENPGAFCTYDSYSWGDELRYTETYKGCDKNISDKIFSPGIPYVKKDYDETKGWSVSGVSDTKIYIGSEHQLACEGKNTWWSYLVGSFVMSSGAVIIHFKTTETQVLNHVDGGPLDEEACPAGQEKTTYWEENFYLSDKMQIVSPLGEVIGYAPGLARSRGGNPKEPLKKSIGTDGAYDSRFIRGWFEEPAGVSTQNTSH